MISAPILQQQTKRMPVSSARHRVRRATTALLTLFVGLSGQAPAQTRQRPPGNVAQGSASALSPSSEAADTESGGRSISGRVINTLTGAPIVRALVRINSSGMLTDHEGRFEFNDVVGDATVQVLKPGFTAGGDPVGSGMRFIRLSDSTGPVELHLTPEALITGSVASKAGEPLAKVLIQLRRAIYNQPMGGLQIVSQTATDSHGRFRFPVAAGDYVLETQFDPGSQGTGEAVLPVRYPAGSSEGSSTTMHLKGGEQRDVELHPEVKRSFTVMATTDADRPIGQIVAYPATGVPIKIGAQNTGHGELRFALPRGTYTLKVMSRQMDSSDEAVTRLTVTDHNVTGVLLNFVPVPAIPIELEFEPATKSDNETRRPQQANLVLEPVGAGASDEMQNLQPDRGRQRPGDAPVRATLHAPAGTYKVSEMGYGGNWYVKSITFGGTDLLTQNLTVAAAADGTPIRVRYSDQVGDLSCTVALNGKLFSGSVYLIPTTLSPVPVLQRRAGPDGKLSVPNVPPGTYDVVATEFAPNIALTDAGIRSRFAGYVKTLTVREGEKANLDLAAVPEAELQP